MSAAVGAAVRIIILCTDKGDVGLWLEALAQSYD